MYKMVGVFNRAEMSYFIFIFFDFLIDDEEEDSK